MNTSELHLFVAESNRIERIFDTPTAREIQAHQKFLDLKRVEIAHLESFVSAVAPGAELRLKQGMNVSVGNHLPPRGGPGIGYSLGDLLIRANESGADPYSIHVEYETLHPFMDGNGRSGRVLWAWMMERSGNPMIRLGFLHAFYYQALSGARTR